jgi:MIP family channel proteins
MSLLVLDKERELLWDRRPYMAELIGTFFFVFIGAGSIMAAAYSGSSSLLTIAFAHGFSIFAMVSMFVAVSGGHFNPAVTFAMIIKGEIGLVRGAMYVGSQITGAVVATNLLSFISDLLQANVGAVKAANLGVPALGNGVSWELGFVIEVVLTAILVTVILRTAVEQKLSLAPLVIGTAVFIDILMGGPFTGAAMNPARWFGPALVSGSWDNHWVYWGAPLVGAVLAYIINEVTLRKSDK